jgi:endonuclease YncB( thermonuclease family)
MFRAWRAPLPSFSPSCSATAEPRTVAAQAVIGRAHVIDGDTLDVAGDGGTTRIRLNAIDAPERDQTCRDQTGGAFACGAEATAELRQLIEGREIQCEPRYLDRYRRTVATCFLGSVDIGRRMVRQVAFRKYGTQYVPDEDEARSPRSMAGRVHHANRVAARASDTIAIRRNHGSPRLV